MVVEETKIFAAMGPVSSVSCSRGWGGEGDAVAHGVELERVFEAGGGVDEALFGGVEVHPGPLGVSDGPGGFGSLDEAVDGADLELDGGLLGPVVVVAFEEVVEEALLQGDAVVGVELGPVFNAVDFEPFLVGGGVDEGFEVAARVEALAAPVGGGEDGAR